jgi:hypothetical protein
VATVPSGVNLGSAPATVPSGVDLGSALQSLAWGTEYFVGYYRKLTSSSGFALGEHGTTPNFSVERKVLSSGRYRTVTFSSRIFIEKADIEFVVV